MTIAKPILTLTLLGALALTALGSAVRPLGAQPESQADTTLRPRVIASTPAAHEEIAPDQPIQITFDQPMDRASVQAALTVSASDNTHAAPQITWRDDQTLTVTFAVPLTRDQQYTLNIAASAKSSAGTTLADAYRLAFDVTTALKVSQVIPAANTAQVQAAATITVVFNRPVVPLVNSADQKNLVQPLTLSPDVAGHGEWVNTSIFVFHPDKPLVGGTTFTVTVAAGLKDVTGSPLETAYTWKFSTIAPQILSVTPQQGMMLVALNQPIVVTFNQPMDRASTEKAFSLTDPSGASVSGKFAWDDANLTLTFTPDAKFAFSTIYHVSLTAAARGASQSTSTAAIGSAALSNPFNQQFTSVPYPAFVNSQPENGSKEVLPGSGVSLEYTAPMDEKSFVGHVHISPAADNFSISGGGTQLYINFTSLPRTTYTITIDAGVTDVYGNPIKTPTVITFTTGAVPPQLTIAARGGVGLTNGYKPDTVLLAGSINVSQINADLYTIALPDLIAHHDNNPPANAQRVRTIQQPVEKTPDKNTVTKLLLNGTQGGALKPGLYWLDVTSPQTTTLFNPYHIQQTIAVGTLNLTMKTTPADMLIWATDLKSGQPVANAPITVYNSNYGNNALNADVIASGKTDANGLYRAPIHFDANQSQGVWAVAQADGLFGIVSNQNDQVRPIDSDTPISYSYGGPTEQVTAYVYTDQPIYRPGHPVYFRGILRDQNDVTYSLPVGAAIHVRLSDQQGKSLYEKDLTLNEFGTFDGKYDLAADAPIGSYQLQVTYKGQQLFGQGFQVAEYRPPDFQVTAAAKVPQVVANDTIQVDVDSKFFFGGAVSNAKLSWNAVANQNYFNYTGDGDWSFAPVNDYSRFYRYNPPRTVGSGTGTTDANGHFTVSLPADLGGLNVTQAFTIEATITDLNNQPISGRTTVTVHPAKVYVGVRPAAVVAEAGKPVNVNLITVGWDSAPIANQKVRVDVSLLEWQQDPQTLQWSQVKTPVIGDSVTTDAKGRASYPFTPSKAGSYVITASTRDSGEKLAESGTYLWISGPQAFNDNPDDRSLKLIADKKEYVSGDTASILIPSPFSGTVKALVTVERAGLMKTDVIDLTGGQTYKLPITMEDAPNVYVSVVLIKGMDDATSNPDFRSGVVMLHTRVAQKLTVKLTPVTNSTNGVGNGTAQPGDTVHFDVFTTDRDGKPIAASVGLSLTDLANLSVADSNSGAIFDTFWSDHALSVFTSISLNALIDTITPQPKTPTVMQAAATNNAAAPMPQTGGGGTTSEAQDGATLRDANKPVLKDGQAAAAPRTNFVDTPFWGQAVTGADGHGAIDVKLPDNLTTWRLDGRGISKDTYAGQATTDVISTKPLLIRPATPRFFVVGDESELAAVINNNTDSDLSVNVTLDAKGVTIKGDAAQTVQIPKAGRARVVWNATVADVANVDLTFSAVSGQYNDASKPAVGLGDARLLPVYKYVAPDYVATAGTLTAGGTRTEGIVLPTGTAAPTSGSLIVRLNPSLAATTLDGLTYLQNYPYQCTEQTISKFLPNIITYRALQKLGLDTPKLKADLQQAIGEALARLKTGQHADGGWGWYPQEQSNPQVTAYAVLGLIEAKSADLLVDASMRDRGIRFLLSSVKPVSRDTAFYDLNMQVFVTYVLARASNANPAVLESLFAQREKMNYFARAFLAQAYAAAQGDRGRIDTLLSDLSNAAILSATGAHWEEPQRDWWNWDSDTRTTAIVLKTLVDLTPKSELIPNVVRWLMVARRGDAWESTQETAWAVMGLTDWMSISGELKANYNYTVALNGNGIGDGKAGPDTLRDTQTLTVDVKKLLTDQVNKLAVQRGDGNGALYYTATLSVNQPVEAIAPTARGLSFTRTYLLNGKPVNSAQVGDLLTVSLDISIPHNLYYVVINDPIPAGTEAVDTSLRTTTQIGQTPQLDRVDANYGWGWWWFSDTQLRTDKVVLSARYLPAGTYHYVYQVRATTAGTYRVIPPNGQEFYFPEVFGRGVGSLFTVKDAS